MSPDPPPHSSLFSLKKNDSEADQSGSDQSGNAQRWTSGQLCSFLTFQHFVSLRPLIPSDNWPISGSQSHVVLGVPVLSGPWAAGRPSRPGSPRPRLGCTGQAAPARCAGWSHIRWGHAGSHRDVAAARRAPPGRRRNVSELSENSWSEANKQK